MDPFHHGRSAWHDGEKRDANPYEAGSQDHGEWDDGWEDAERDNGQFGMGA